MFPQLYSGNVWLTWDFKICDSIDKSFPQMVLNLTNDKVIEVKTSNIGVTEICVNKFMVSAFLSQS